ncbi:MAG: DUF2339 domain-containing protein, partial [Clostridia bacterium]|nr:DUF2339 domain-containing protein [Clostridia bacterium]
MKQSFRKLLDAQKGLVKELDSLVGEFEASDFVNQNISLQKELENFKKLNEELKKNYYQARKENDSLRAALKEQILDEKLNILRISKKKMEAYFQDMSEKYNNGLIALEHSAAERLANMKLIASRELGNEKEAFIKEAERLFLELQSKIKAKIQNQAAEKQKALDEISESYSRLESKDISEEEIQKRVRQNNLEVKIGLNLINKAGILLILIGIATGLGYSYKFLSPALKGIFAFVIGGLFLAAGELFSRKEKSAVALGFTGGGIGILYLAIFNCYFVLHIIEMPIALLLSVLVTAAAFTFSLVYDSKTICSLALAGGFLPFFSYSFSHEMAADAIYIAMVYLFILNLLTMSISLFKKWDIANYISFILNVPTLIYLISLVPHEGASILYSILTFSMYLVVILAYPFRHKTGLKAVDSIFLGLNTAISCTIIFSLFEASKATVLGDLRLKDFKGLLAVMFCLIYFGLGQFVEKKMSSEKFARVLFYLTSFTFAVLMIPFQFGVKWLAMGWLVEGVLMIAYGFSNKLKGLETGGWIVYALCSLVFFAAEFLPFVLLGERTNPNLFYFKYSAIIAGSLCILFVYLYDMAKDASAKYTTRGQLINLFKYFSIITLWIYMAYMAHEAYNIFVKSKQLNNSLYQTFTFAFVTLLAGYIIT